MEFAIPNKIGVKATWIIECKWLYNCYMVPPLPYKIYNLRVALQGSIGFLLFYSLQK